MLPTHAMVTRLLRGVVSFSPQEFRMFSDMEDINKTQSVINNYQIVYNNIRAANGLFCPFNGILL